MADRIATCSWQLVTSTVSCSVRLTPLLSIQQMLNSIKNRWDFILCKTAVDIFDHDSSGFIFNSFDCLLQINSFYDIKTSDISPEAHNYFLVHPDFTKSTEISSCVFSLNVHEYVHLLTSIRPHDTTSNNIERKSSEFFRCYDIYGNWYLLRWLHTKYRTELIHAIGCGAWGTYE